MIARSQNIVDALFFDIGWFAIESNLPAPLKNLFAALDHGEVSVRGLMVERLCSEILRCGARLKEGPAHPGFSETIGNRSMAIGADSGVDVVVGLGCGRARDGVARG